MRQIFLFLSLTAFIAVAITIGLLKKPLPEAESPGLSTHEQELDVPHIGKIEVLNGCGEPGVARDFARILRKNNFDVKNDGISNAATFNYPFTLVASRSRDMDIAHAIADAIGIEEDKVILLRSTRNDYDATLIAGNDFEKYLSQ